MMAPEHASDEAEVLEWIIRVRDPEFEDWDDLTAWLAADPRNAERFDRIAMREAEIVDALRTAPPQPTLVIAAPPKAPARTLAAGAQWRTARWGLLAASLALASVFGLTNLRLEGGRQRAPAAIMTVATRAGERRVLHLAGLADVTVAGATRLRIDLAARRVELAEGQATFSVVHDPRRTFVVRLGDLTVTDLGTVFDLRRRNGRALIAVARGEVRVDRGGLATEVSAGHRLRFNGASAAELDDVAPAAVTAWQQGRFSYDDAPIAEVVADIEQTTGANIVISPQVVSQRFAGAISLNGEVGHALEEIAPLLKVSVSRSRQSWVLGPARNTLRR